MAVRVSGLDHRGPFLQAREPARETTCPFWPSCSKDARRSANNVFKSTTTRNRQQDKKQEKDDKKRTRKTTRQEENGRNKEHVTNVLGMSGKMQPILQESGKGERETDIKDGKNGPTPWSRLLFLPGRRQFTRRPSGGNYRHSTAVAR
jgi:hypothetical protein